MVAVTKTLLGDKAEAARWLPFAYGKLRSLGIGQSAVYSPAGGVLVRVHRTPRHALILIQAGAEVDIVSPQIRIGSDTVFLSGAPVDTVLKGFRPLPAFNVNQFGIPDFVAGGATGAYGRDAFFLLLAYDVEGSATPSGAAYKIFFGSVHRKALINSGYFDTSQLVKPPGGYVDLPDPPLVGYLGKWPTQDTDVFYIARFVTRTLGLSFEILRSFRYVFVGTPLSISPQTFPALMASMQVTETGCAVAGAYPTNTGIGFLPPQFMYSTDFCRNWAVSGGLPAPNNTDNFFLYTAAGGLGSSVVGLFRVEWDSGAKTTDVILSTSSDKAETFGSHLTVETISSFTPEQFKASPILTIGAGEGLCAFILDDVSAGELEHRLYRIGNYGAVVTPLPVPSFFAAVGRDQFLGMDLLSVNATEEQVIAMRIVVDGVVQVHVSRDSGVTWTEQSAIPYTAAGVSLPTDLIYTKTLVNPAPLNPVTYA